MKFQKLKTDDVMSFVASDLMVGCVALLLIINNSIKLGCGGGLEVSILAFYSDDPSSNPAGYKIRTKRNKLMEKRPELAHLFKTIV